MEFVQLRSHSAMKKINFNNHLNRKQDSQNQSREEIVSD